MSDEEQRGKQVFASQGCAQCHTPQTAYSNFGVAKLEPLPVLPGFDEHLRPDTLRVPSLLYARHAAPYFHDASTPDLAVALERHFERLGRSGIEDADRAALAAFVASIGMITDGSEPSPSPVVNRQRFHLDGAVQASQRAPRLRPTVEATKPASAAPSPADWSAAAATVLPHAPKGCTAKRVREWFQLRCSGLDYDSAGDRVHPSSGAVAHSSASARRPLVITFPIRRRDARLFSVGRIVQYGKFGNWEDEAFALSESWPDDEPAATILVLAGPVAQQLEMPDLLRFVRGGL